MPPARIELATFALQVQRSTTKLRRRIYVKISEGKYTYITLSLKCCKNQSRRKRTKI